MRPRRFALAGMVFLTLVAAGQGNRPFPKVYLDVFVTDTSVPSLTGDDFEVFRERHAADSRVLDEVSKEDALSVVNLGNPPSQSQ